MKSKAYLQYELFNKVNSSTDKICNDKNDEHKKPKTINSHSLKLCYNMEDIFSSFSVLCPSYEEVGSKCCEYLLYWLYGKVSNEEYDLFNIHWLYYKFHLLLEKTTWHHYKKIKCSTNFLRILNRKLLKNKKALYDFLDHYDIIKEELEDNTTTITNKNQYCKYIGYIYRLFENMLMDPNSQSIQAYRHEMENFKAKIIDKDLDFIKNSCDTYLQKSMFRINKKTLHTLINEQLKDVKKTDVSFRNKHLVNYDIFWDLDSYQKYETYARKKNNGYSAASEYYCKPDKINAAEDYENIKDLCKLFISYFLYMSYNNDQNVPSGKRHLGYMNYWLNKELKKKNNNISATAFVEILNVLLDKYFSGIDNYNKFKNIVYNIDDKIFEELDLLRKLQDYYNKIITESTDKDKCPEYGRNFTKLFEEGIRKYHETKNKKFYIELLRIWARYNIEANGTKKCNNLPEPPVIEKLNQKEKAASLSKTRELCKTYTNIRLDTPQHWNQEHASILEHLSANEVYNKLNKVTSDDNTCAKYCANIIHSTENIEEFKKLCPKLTSNIKNLSKTLEDTKSPDDRCTYLTYWAYEKIINIFDSNTRHVHDKFAINELNQAVFMANSEFPAKDKCLFSFTGNLSEWKDEKLLHESHVKV
ncbi:Plasmodium vivax Vir protein, putative [Plasmodium vivax]|uniref:Vir protein, putative n=1 Tax=Plasmodium vivax TaxID=5855 RepID=A0A1G4GVS6_PLAVI|nr:Plasmodium vivax Vir protein, putative [Plasmodium vivax]